MRLRFSKMFFLKILTGEPNRNETPFRDDKTRSKLIVAERFFIFKMSLYDGFVWPLYWKGPGSIQHWNSEANELFMRQTDMNRMRILAQQSTKFGMFPCMCCASFFATLQTQQLTTWANTLVVHQPKSSMA